MTGDGESEQAAVSGRIPQETVDAAQVVALFALTIGTLPVFATVSQPIEGQVLSLAAGLGGWSMWCCIVIFATRGWVTDD